MATTYNVYQDGTKTKTGITDKTVDITGLTPETTYKFQVTSETDGEESDKSNEISVKTLAPESVKVTGVTVAPKNATGTTGTAGTKQFNATVAPTNATNKEVKFSIAPTTAGITVDASTGLVSFTAEAEEAVITVTATTTDQNKTDTGTLTLSAPAK